MQPRQALALVAALASSMPAGAWCYEPGGDTPAECRLSSSTEPCPSSCAYCTSPIEGWGQECEHDFDCAGGELCVRRTCYDPDDGDRDLPGCQWGSFCLAVDDTASECRCDDDCEGDRVCSYRMSEWSGDDPSGGQLSRTAFVCYDERPPEGAGCIVDDDCPAHEVCTRQGTRRCGQGLTTLFHYRVGLTPEPLSLFDGSCEVSLAQACTPIVAAPCLVDEHCPERMFCDVASAGHCYEGEELCRSLSSCPAWGADCDDDEPCPAGLACWYEGRCRPRAEPCEGDADCGDGWRCQRFVPEGDACRDDAPTVALCFPDLREGLSGFAPAGYEDPVCAEPEDPDDGFAQPSTEPSCACRSTRGAPLDAAALGLVVVVVLAGARSRRARA